MECFIHRRFHLVFFLFLAFTHEFDLGRTSQTLLPPLFVDIAAGKRIEATATCGEGIDIPSSGELYCELTEADVEESENLGEESQVNTEPYIQQCGYCDAKRPSKAHPATLMLDGGDGWWQSPSLSRGLNYQRVNITISLEQIFLVAHITITFAISPRPAAWVLERSKNYGASYEPWQYFAKNRAMCLAMFGVDPWTDIKRNNDVVCSTEFSAVRPIQGGKVVVSLIRDRPGAYSYTKSLQEWTKATNVRIRLLKANVLPGHTPNDARYFYSIKEILIGGRCFCHGHASSCSPRGDGLMHCDCQHNTCGATCTRCCPGYMQYEWRESLFGRPFVCGGCNCHGHSNTCKYSPRIAANHLSMDKSGKYRGGGLCLSCKHKTKGINCNQCQDGYHQHEGVSLTSLNICQPCDCHPEGSVGKSCTKGTRQCHCRPNVQGRRCNMCVAGYQDFPACRLPTWAVADEAVIEFSNESAVLFGFTPYSHFQYPTLDESFRSGGVISVEIRTTIPNGLIFYVADDRSIDMMTLYLEEGHVVFGFDMGSGPLYISSPDTVNDGEWHMIEAIRPNGMRQKFDSMIAIDGVQVAWGANMRGSRHLVTMMPLYVGGLPRDVYVDEVEEKSAVSFVGCIKNLRLNGVLAGSPIGSQDVRPCTDETGSAYWSCSMASQLNSTNATEPDDEGIRFGMTPNSRLEYKKLSRDFRRKGKISVEFRTKAHAGVVFYAGADERNVDFETLFMRDGKLVYGFNYGSGNQFIIHEETVNDNQWHNVTVTRLANHGLLEVDGVEVVKAEILGNARVLRTDTPFYLGGIPAELQSEELHFEVESRISFKGCLKNLLLKDEEPSQLLKEYDVQPCSRINEDAVYFGSGGGHVTVDESFHVGKSVTITLSIRPQVSSAMIFSVQDDDNGDFTSLEMDEGVLYFRADNGGGMFEARYFPREGVYFLCNGEWHEVQAVKSGNQLSLTVDGQQGVPGLGSSSAQVVNTKDPLHFGSLPDGVSHLGIGTNQSYVGCMRNIVVKSKLIDLMEATDVTGDVKLHNCFDE